MADKYNKVEPKVSLGILISLAAFIVVALTLILIALPSNRERIYTSYEATANLDYFTEDHPYYEINASKVEKYINRGDTFLLLISSSDCTSCQSHIGTIQRYYESTGADALLDQIYYYTPKDDAEGLNRLMELSPDILDLTPQLILFVDGEVVLSLDANLSTTEQTKNTNVRSFFEDAIALIEESE